MAEKVVKGSGAKGPSKPKPKIKNPGKLFMRLLKYIMQEYKLHCIVYLPVLLLVCLQVCREQCLSSH